MFVLKVLDHLFKATEQENDWNTRVSALNVIASFGNYAPEQLGYSLPRVVPAVTANMSDTKKQVAEAAKAALTASCEVIGNRDIEHMTPFIIQSFISRFFPNLTETMITLIFLFIFLLLFFFFFFFLFFFFIIFLF